MADMNDRKKRIMEHISRSTGDFIKQSPSNSPQRKEQILDHIRRTKG